MSFQITPSNDALTDICRIQVKFSEIDSMRRVWHGTYVTYFEDGRESFGRHFPGIGYDVMQQTGIYAPVYEVHVRHLAPLAMNDVAVIHTTYVPQRGARLDYSYKVYRESDQTLCAEGSTTQLFLDKDGQLMLEQPDYYIEWLKKYGFTSDQNPQESHPTRQ